MACRTSTGWCCHTCPSTPRAPSEAQIINMMLAPASDGLHVFAGALHCGGRARRSRGSTPPERDSAGFPARDTLLYRIELPTVSRLYVSGTPSRAPPSGHGATGEGVAIGAAGDVDREALGSGPEAPIRRALSRPPTSRSVEKAASPEVSRRPRHGSSKD